MQRKHHHAVTRTRSIIRKFRSKAQQFVGDWPDPVRNPNASEFEVDLWILSRFVLEKIAPVVGTHPYPLNELLLMTATACAPMVGAATRSVLT